MAKYSYRIIQPGECRAVWPKVKELLLPAILATGGRWEPEYVLAGLVLGEQTLWAYLDEKGVPVGAATTEIVNYPAKRMLAIHFLGGHDMNEWYRVMSDAFTDFARLSGCAGIECNARFGFWKWFKDDGFIKSSMFYEKVI